MKPLKTLLGSIAVCHILLTGCTKDLRTDPQTSLNQSKQSSANLKDHLRSLRAELPADFAKEREQSVIIIPQLHPEYRAVVESATNALTPTSCNSNTALIQWMKQQLTDWDNNVTFFASVTGMLNFPTYNALLFEDGSANQYFGVNGEYTQRVTKTFKDLQRFWNMQSQDIVLVAMHGSILRDKEKVTRMVRALYGGSEEDAGSQADFILSLIKKVPQYRNGDHPIFTFNAFAKTTSNIPPFGAIDKKIIIGDGTLEAYSAIGYGDVAPQAILAHEFGHHVQAQLNVFGSELNPESSRRTELMADALSAYYLSHARGASMQWKRVKQFLQVFANMGDCAFNDGNHHGTPTQRTASAEWAYNLSKDAQKQGHILTAQQFVALFDAKLPRLVQL